MVTRSRRQVAYRDLVALDDARFIHEAYLAILGRAPEESERFFLNHLRNGAQKTRILRDLLASDEGRRYGARLTGFSLACTIDRMRDVPGIGHAIGLLTTPGNRTVAGGRDPSLEARLSKLEAASGASPPLAEASSQLSEQLAQITCLLDVRHQRIQAQFHEIQDTLANIEEAFQAGASDAEKRERSLQDAMAAIRLSVEELQRSLPARGADPAQVWPPMSRANSQPPV